MAYADTILADGATHLWLCGDAQGSTVDDSVSSGAVDGTVVGTPRSWISNMLTNLVPMAIVGVFVWLMTIWAKHR